MTRKRGRPPLDPTDRSVGVSVRFPSRTLDALEKHASTARVSVPEWIRRNVAPGRRPPVVWRRDELADYLKKFQK